MASPAATGAMGTWNHQNQAAGHSNINAVDESGVQVRPMGLKVHYTFDKDAKLNCLARYTQTLQIQTIPIDESTSIGVVDLRTCVQAITECSPELAGQDCDYTVYAVDHSEPNTPLVGQGMLSWALDSILRGDMTSQPKLVTGRVTRNLLGVFAGGNKDTLEVTLRLSASVSNKMQWATDSFDMQAAMTPTGNAEWNSFLQSNPQLGHNSQISRVASPAMSQGPPVSMNRRDSLGPTNLQHSNTTDVQRIAPTPVDSSMMPILPGGSSRPSSRASNRAPRKRQPTGRPRGRPRKKPVEGNTSGYEDGTEGEDGPSQKRVKLTTNNLVTNNNMSKGDRAPNPFAPISESLRVAASTSASLRKFRPIAANPEGAAGAGHMQEVPRAPTPVPNGEGFPGRKNKMRRESSLSQKPMTLAPAPSYDQRHPLSPAHDDGRSPDSIGPTPSYSEDSPGEIGSSPPMRRATPYLRSSPPPSSPILPPMPSAQLRPDVSFVTDNMDDLFGDETPLPLPREESRARFWHPAPSKPVAAARDSGISVDVFQVQNVPGGQDLVHICSQRNPQINPPSSNNTPRQAMAASTHINLIQTEPTQILAGSVSGEQPSLPPLKKQAASKRPKAPKSIKAAPSPPGQEPTPPPTTDAVDKAPSPVTALETAQTGGDTPASSHEPSLVAEPAKAQAPPIAPVEQITRPSSQPPSLSAKPRRPLARSHSTGPLALPTIPASEPAGPSNLSQSMAADASYMDIPQLSSVVRRGSCNALSSVPVPASDPPAPVSTLIQQRNMSFSEAPCPPSEPVLPAPSSPTGTRSNKNVVKKHAIKQRLEEAIQNGEMPPFCTNCGAIETPTWRKIWVRELDGVPEYVEYSEKPGRITAIEIISRDADEKPTRYRVIKKSLGTTDDRAEWQELLLCNPCGIWLSKSKSHRPRDRWDKDASRLGRERRKRRDAGRGLSRSKTASGKLEGLTNPTSEAYLYTDGLGPIEPSSPKMPEVIQAGPSQPPQFPNFQNQSMNSTTSPINVELDEVMGVTKRLLFPSPRKDGVVKVLGDLQINMVQTSATIQDKTLLDGKENMATADSPNNSKDHDELEALFRSPVLARPSTPPPQSVASGASFKTPTQPTPNHRPITRSVSRSIRSVRSILASPSQMALLQRTPTKTPMSILAVPGSGSVRRSPRHHHSSNFGVFDTPMSRTINQMLSEPNGFGMDGNDLDLTHLPSLDSHGDGLLDFGSLLSTDGIMPSSPPKHGSLSFDYEASEVWASWGVDNPLDHE